MKNEPLTNKGFKLLPDEITKDGSAFFFREIKSAVEWYKKYEGNEK